MWSNNLSGLLVFRVAVAQSLGLNMSMGGLGTVAVSGALAVMSAGAIPEFRGLARSQDVGQELTWAVGGGMVARRQTPGSMLAQQSLWLADMAAGELAMVVGPCGLGAKPSEEGR